jgi:hypothetical protein
MLDRGVKYLSGCKMSGRLSNGGFFLGPFYPQKKLIFLGQAISDKILIASYSYDKILIIAFF